jgi:hypothetical protein
MTLTLNQLAKRSGIVYLLLIPLGIFGIIYVPINLIVTNDITQTINNISANEMLFRGSILSALTVQLFNIMLVVLLFKLFKHVNKTATYLMVICSLLAVPIAFLNEINHLAVLNLLDSSTFEAENLISLFLDLHQYGIILAQVFWGLWLFPLGYLIYKSGMVPKFIGVLLMIGCMGYVVDSITLILFPSLGFTLSEFTFLGEVIFPLWLLIKGVKQQ